MWVRVWEVGGGGYVCLQVCEREYARRGECGPEFVTYFVHERALTGTRTVLVRRCEIVSLVGTVNGEVSKQTNKKPFAFSSVSVSPVCFVYAN